MSSADRSDVERALWRFALSSGFRGELAAADRAVHLARGVRAGVDVEEILERIEAGELEAVRP